MQQDSYGHGYHKVHTREDNRQKLIIIMSFCARYIDTGAERLNPLPPIPDPDIEVENPFERHLNFLSS